VKVLITGGSSFTGFWFVRALSEAGHEVFATFTKGDEGHYHDIRGQRVREAVAFCTPVWNCEFGDDKFVNLLKSHNDWDLLCHHGAYVRDYKSLAFDYTEAVKSNTRGLDVVLPQLVESRCNKVLLTGSVFEQNEGAGELPLRAFSPYGLSKAMTADVFRYWTGHFGLELSKFVIPNPFGPMEERRFLAYLMSKWLNDETASVSTPDYIRDNIHVSLLARIYCEFAEKVAAGTGRNQLNPNGYVESQGTFAQRVAKEIAPRIGKACVLSLTEQASFDEPVMRVNYDRVALDATRWDEAKAWDELAEYYVPSEAQRAEI
jgi:nucleoside-diphosphate-sugar epimerase